MASDRIVLPYVIPLIHQAIDASGYSIAVTESSEPLAVDASLRLATPDEPIHVVTMAKGQDAHLDHFLVNACYKIMRSASTPADQRVEPVSRIQRLPSEQSHELAERIKGTPRDLIDELSRVMYSGVVRQLAASPMDLRVERQIRDDLPVHRPRQAEYFRKQARELQHVLHASVREMTPDLVYWATLSMNAATADELGDICNEALGLPFESVDSDADDLVEALRSEPDPGYRGDVRVVDRWASILDLHDWYDWRPMQD